MSGRPPIDLRQRIEDWKEKQLLKLESRVLVVFAVFIVLLSFGMQLIEQSCVPV